MSKMRSILFLWAMTLMDLPLSAQAQMPVKLSLQVGHTAPVLTVAFSRDGRYAFSAGIDHTAILWDVTTGAELRRFEGHTQVINSVAFSPDDRFVLTGSADNSARMWDRSTGAELKRFEGHLRAIEAVGFSVDGTSVLTSSLDHTMRLWKVGTAAEIRRYEGTNGPMAISLDGKQILTGIYDKSNRIGRGSKVLLWDLESGRVVREIETLTYPTALTFSPDGREALIARRGGVGFQPVELWNLTSGIQVGQLIGHHFEVTSVAFSPDGRVAATGALCSAMLEPCVERGARVWDVKTGNEIRSLETTGFVHSVAFSPTGTALLTGMGDGIAQIWDVKTGDELMRLEGASDPVSSVDFAADGMSLLIRGRISPGVLWELNNREVSELFEKSGVDIAGDIARISPDGITVFTGYRNGIVRIWKRKSRRLIREISVPGLAWRGGSYSPNGQYISTGTIMGAVQEWELETGQQSRRFYGASSEIYSLAYSPNGKYLAAGTEREGVFIWDVSNGEVVKRFVQAKSIVAVTFAPDSSFLLAVDEQSRVLCWDPATGRMVCEFAVSGPASSVRISHDGRFLLLGLGDRTSNSASLWDISAGKNLRQFGGHKDEVSDVDISSDGRFVITGSGDGTSRIWDTNSSRHLATLVSLRDGRWAALTPEGHFDASDINNLRGLYWLQGEEVILPEYLNVRRFYTPGLLSIVTCPYRQASGCPTLPAVADLRQIAPRPEVVVTPPTPGSTLAKVVVKNRGGGIGDLSIRVNGRELALSTRSPKPKVNAPSATLWIDLAAAPRNPSGKNSIDISAYDGKNIARFPGNRVIWQTKVLDDKPRALWGVVVGTSQYADPNLTLTYPDKDAESFSLALDLGGKGLLADPSRVHIQTLTSRGTLTPTKDHIREEIFKVAKLAAPEDTFVLYMAGHGVAWKDTYYYLTTGARGADVGADAELRKNATISSDELADWLRQPGIPKKVVVILDTCAAGAAARIYDKISNRRDLSSDHKKALQRLREVDDGYHFLMGSAADRVSYEASRYGQGLLTYALLFGMQGAAKGADGTLDVQALFRSAEDQVPRLAEGIGGIQKPEIRSGKNFPLARFSREDAEKIPLAQEKPVLIQLLCATATLADPLKLRPRLGEALRAASDPVARGSGIAESKLVYLSQVTEDIPRSYSPRILYRVEGDKVMVEIRLVQNEKVAVERRIEGLVTDLDLVEKIVGELIAATKE